MDIEEQNELWLRYTAVWRNVLTQVLDWPERKVTNYIKELRNILEASLNNPFDFGFFFDPPCRYLAQALLGGGLHQRIMDCKNKEANPVLIFQRLVNAIEDRPNGGDLEDPSFDWDKARIRYQKERRDIEAWLAEESRK